MKKVCMAAAVVIVIALIAFGFVSKGTKAPRSVPPTPGTGTAAGSPGPQAENAPDTQGPQPQTIDVPTDKQKLLGIRTTEVRIRPLTRTIRTVGRVEYDEKKLATVNLRVEGYVEKLYADSTGVFVKKGAPLAEIYSPELLSTELEFINLLKWRKVTGHRFQRNVEFEWGDRYGTTAKVLSYDLESVIDVAKQKLALWEIPETKIKELEETQTPFRTFTVYSPVAGYVIQKPAVRGTKVSPGDKLFDIADLSTVWVIADIYEYELPHIKAGQEASISASYTPGRRYTSKLDYIYPSLSPQTRTARARFVIQNRDLALKPQMYTNVEISVDMGTRLSIPEEAVLDSGRRQVVYVDQGDGYFSPRSVRIGVRGGGLVEITEGLKEGEKVASSALFLLDSESKLKGGSGQ